MNGEKLVKQLEVIRAITIKSIESISEEMADEMPTGYKNTIRWHLGHIAALTDLFSNNFVGLPFYLSEEHLAMFKPGSKPSDWQAQPPSLEQLASLLKGQMEHIKCHLGTRDLEEKANKPLNVYGNEMESIGEVLNFCLYHEGFHLGYINGRTPKPIKRALI